MSNTYRVVVDYSNKPGVHNASGLYNSMLEAKGALLDVARTWVGLADSIELRVDGSILIRHARDGVTIIYSVLAERKAPAFENTPFGFEANA